MKIVRVPAVARKLFTANQLCGWAFDSVAWSPRPQKKKRKKSKRRRLLLAVSSPPETAHDLRGRGAKLM